MFKRKHLPKNSYIDDSVLENGASSDNYCPCACKCKKNRKPCYYGIDGLTMPQTGYNPPNNKYPKVNNCNIWTTP